MWDGGVKRGRRNLTLGAIVFMNDLAVLVALKQWAIPGDVEVTVDNHFDLGI